MSVTVLSCGLGNQEHFQNDALQHGVFQKQNTREGQIEPDFCGFQSAQASSLIAVADVVYGSRKLLENFSVPAHKCRVLGAHARTDAETLLQKALTGTAILVLASGDALFHGMGGTLSRLAASMNPAPELRFLPGVTAFQSLFARLGLPWDAAVVYSAHHSAQRDMQHGTGFSLRCDSQTSAPHETVFSLRCALASPLSVIYGGTRRTAAHLAQELLVVQPQAASRRAVLADSLGTPQERIVTDRLDEIARLADSAELAPSPTSMLVLLPGDALPPVLPLGLPIDQFEREAGLITAPDVRAVVLSRLRLPAWGCLWDMGAGSGSVGLEAAALCPHLDVWAVERKPERVAMCQRNATRLGLANHRTLTGDVLTSAANLPAPDRIFFGGSGEDAVHDLLQLGWERLKPGGIMILSAVTLETQHRAYGWHPERRTALCSVAVCEERPLAGRYHHLEPQRPIHLYCYCKAEPPIC